MIARPGAQGYGDQSVRMRRFLLASGAYAVCLPLLAVAHLLDLVLLGPALRIGVLMLAVNVTFFLLFRSGLNQRFADPSLTWAQVVIATFVLMFAVYHFDKERGLALMMCLVVLSFGAFRFGTRQFFTASGLVLAGYSR